MVRYCGVLKQLNHGIQIPYKIYKHGLPQFTTKCHGVPWYNMVYHVILYIIPHNTIVYHAIPLYVFIRVAG